MPLYGDIAHAAKMLRATETWDMGTDVDDRLTAIQAAISLALEHKCGRTWGVVSVDTSLLHWAGAYDTLVLRIPARSITSITTGGTVSGSTMTGGTVTLAADLVDRFVSTDDGLIYGISNAIGDVWDYRGEWSTSLGTYRTPVVVTGDFANTDDDATVPADVTYAANILIVELFKQENASPAGFTGPDGSTVPVRDPWKKAAVTDVIERYSLKRHPMAV